MGSSLGSLPRLPDVDLKGKIILITGANTGIGYETAKTLAQLGAKVTIACRSEAKATEALARMRKEHDEEKAGQRASNVNIKAEELALEFMPLDLASYESTMTFVEAFKAKGIPLHVFICNAGIMWAGEALTQDGFEAHFQVNYLSHFLLVLHLLPVLKSSGPGARVVLVASLAYRFSKWDGRNLQSAGHPDRNRRYANSKLCQIMQMFSLAQRLEGSGVSVFSLHPGVVNTELSTREENQGSATWKMFWGMSRSLNLLRNPYDGALTTLHAAANPAYDGKTALYFEGGTPHSLGSTPRDREKQELLWLYSLDCLRDYVTEDTLKELTSCLGH